MPLSPFWKGESPERDAETLPGDLYQAVLAGAVQRAGGELARALKESEHASASSLVARLKVLVAALEQNVSSVQPAPALHPGWATRHAEADPAIGARLFSDDRSSLFDGLRAVAWNARELDIVVAYAQPAGVELVEGLLQRLIGEGAIVRILVGAYLDGTHPAALRRLMGLASAGPSASVRFVPDRRVHFHPKIYRVLDEHDREHLFVGSVNLSRSALTGADAVEWTLGLDEVTAPSVVALAKERLDGLIGALGEPLTEQLVQSYESNRHLPPDDLLELDAPAAPFEKNDAQAEALERLREVRGAGHKRALVVAATGLGKTVLAALDSLAFAPQGRVLFVAHREEILCQARATFESFRPGQTCGLFNQYEKARSATNVFASVFSIDEAALMAFGAFDYIVIDEAHHAAAKTYRRVLESIGPGFVLGLTATPERLDGGDIYELFDNVVAYEANLLEAIARKWLVPFHYHGLPDPVDYTKLHWQGGPLGYSRDELDAALVDRERLQRVAEAVTSSRYQGVRTLVFCVSIRHCVETAGALREAGLRVAAVHSGPGSDDRAVSVAKLRSGGIDAIVSVDVFNEGVDIPMVDRVVLLRPTDSPSVYLQQLGRGLRKHENKSALTVVDFVGNHKRARLHLELLGMGREEVLDAPAGTEFRRSYQDGREIYIAPGAVDAVQSIHAATRGPRARIDEAFDLARDAADGKRPTLLDVVSRCGLSVATIRSLFGSWLDYLERQDALTEEDRELQKNMAARDLLATVESTSMAGPHKMLLLGAMAEHGMTRVDTLEFAPSFRGFLERRHPAATTHVAAADLKTDRRLAANIRANPAKRLSGKHERQFALDGSRFEIRVPRQADTSALLEAIAERAEARLYDFLRHRPQSDREVVGKVIKQKHGKGLTLNVSRQRKRLPKAGTWIELGVDGRRYFGKVMAEFINVIATEEGGANEATAVLMSVVGAETVKKALGQTVRLTPGGDATSQRWIVELASKDAPTE